MIVLVNSGFGQCTAHNSLLHNSFCSQLVVSNLMGGSVAKTAVGCHGTASLTAVRLESMNWCRLLRSLSVKRSVEPVTLN